MRPAAAIAAALAVVGGAAAASSVAAARATGSEWYACVEPPASPPRWVFSVVWTALYAIVGAALSFFLASGRIAAAGSLCASLALSAAWSAVFFGWRNPEGALALLAGAAAAAVAALALAPPGLWRAALAPYAAWLLFALVLNSQSASRAGACEALRGALREA